MIVCVYDDDEIIISGDIGGKFGGWFSGGIVMFFEKFLGARGGVSHRVEEVIFIVGTFRRIADRYIGITVFSEGGLFSTGKAGGFGGIENEDGIIFVTTRIVGEHFGNISLDGVVIANAVRW